MSAEAVGKSVEETARYLAEEHARHDDSCQEVWWSPADDEVLLVEVTTALVDEPDQEPEILPFGWRADPPDVPHPSTVILLSEAAWHAVQGRLELLPGAFRNLQRIWPREGAA